MLYFQKEEAALKRMIAAELAGEAASEENARLLECRSKQVEDYKRRKKATAEAVCLSLLCLSGLYVCREVSQAIFGG